jgi:hypothetical protein
MAFGLENAAFFFGRTRARNELREVLERHAVADVSSGLREFRRAPSADSAR